MEDERPNLRNSWMFLKKAPMEIYQSQDSQNEDEKQFFKACNMCDLQGVQKILQKGVDVNCAKRESQFTGKSW